MAIPGLKPTFEVVAKVRVGQKKMSASGREIPSSVDYFICDDAEFERLVGAGKNQLRIFLPFQLAEDNFSTGLEWWRGKQLTCYSKGEGDPPLAYRVESMVGDAEVRGEKMGKDRLPITCPVRACPLIRSKDCKPMGRLQFWIDGMDRRAGVYQLDTKAWNSIENIEATLSLYPDLRNVPFILRVEFTSRGTSRFPELYLEADVEVNTDADVTLADALLQLSREVSAANGEPSITLKSRLADVLNLTNPGWREDEVVVNWIREKGVVDASNSLLNRHLK
jgi:hypothetical protein